MTIAAVAGFDLSAAIGAKTLAVWVDFVDGVRVKINYVSREQLREVAHKATVTTFEKHQKREEVDKQKWDEELGALAVADWEGFRNGDAPYPCTPDNVKTVMAKWSVFAKFVGDICVDLESLVAAEKAAERKNSQTGSLPGTTSPP